MPLTTSFFEPARFDDRPSPDMAAGSRRRVWLTARTTPLAAPAWLLAALVLTLVFCARLMAPALASPDVIQDDARQHVFWMARFRDPELFQGDLIASYYQAIAPPAYSALYWLLTRGLSPFEASRVVPPVLGLLTTLFTFLLALRLYPAPGTAFLAASLASWFVWQHEDLVSATARGFMPPLLAAQLWALAAGRQLLGATFAVLAAAFYPTAGIVGTALLGVRLVQWRGWRPAWQRDRSVWAAFLVATVLVGALLVLIKRATAPFDPVAMLPAARDLPLFAPNGRLAVFGVDPLRYWIASEETGLGLMAKDVVFKDLPLLGGYVALAALLPVVLLLRRASASNCRPPRLSLLLQLLVVSFGLFFLAHLLLFQLYLPNRFVRASLPLVLAVLGGLGIGLLIEELSQWTGGRARLLQIGLTLAIGGILLVYPARYHGSFERDPYPAVTEYLRAQPKNALVAGTPMVSDSVPPFAGRPVLLAREYALGFHLGYYGQLERRSTALVDAYYAESVPEVLDFATQYGVDIFLVDARAFDRDEFERPWRGVALPWPTFTASVSRRLDDRRRSRGREDGAGFALLKLARQCTAVRDGDVSVVPTTCVHQVVEQEQSRLQAGVRSEPGQ